MTAHASATTDDSAPNNRADTDWWIRLRCVVSFGALARLIHEGVRNGLADVA